VPTTYIPDMADPSGAAARAVAGSDRSRKHTGSAVQEVTGRTPPLAGACRRAGRRSL